jgi:hypothetical protein
LPKVDQGGVNPMPTPRSLPELVSLATPGHKLSGVLRVGSNLHMPEVDQTGSGTP